jgi:NADPH:quinone reductase-like Zn-dependent oxidoreductase
LRLRHVFLGVSAGIDHNRLISIRGPQDLRVPTSRRRTFGLAPLRISPTRKKSFEDVILKAVQIHAHGGIEQLRYEETKDPELRSPMDVIVKLEAAAVNPVDLAIRAGAHGGELFSPRILGADGAGTVVAVGAEVKNVKLGDAVCLYPLTACGQCRACAVGRECSCTAMQAWGEHNNGTYAEWIRVPATNCFAVPAGLSFNEAAAFPLVYVTVWRMLISHAELRPGEWVLIMGAGGGIATAALHLASAIGARILVASSNEAKLDRALELGAAHGLNYRNPDLAKEVRRLTGKRGVDVVVDCNGGENWVKCLATLARGGRLVTCGAGAGASAKTDLRRIFWNHLKIFGTTPGSRTEFSQLLNFMEVSRRKPIIDRVFPLEDAKWAQQRMQDGQQFGKIVLRVSR